MSRFLKTLFSLKSLARHFSSKSLPFLAGFLFFSLTLILLFSLTTQRSSNYGYRNKTNNIIAEPEKSVPLVAESVSIESSSKPQISEKAKSSEANIWCEVRDYKDLSNDPSILLFQRWVDDFNELSCLHNVDVTQQELCLEHDPRKLGKMLAVGEKLAKERRPIFAQIIRGDPEKALDLAVSAEVIEKLPSSITRHLEVWESDFIDITAINVCYDQTHANLIIKRAEFENKRNFRLWTYGTRAKIQTIKGISAWGISLGKDFAMSDKPYRVESHTEDSGNLLLGNVVIPYASPAKKDLLASHLLKAERRGHQNGGKMNYRVVMGSDGDVVIQSKYILRTPATFADAYQDALEKKGSLLVIDNQAEQEEVLLF